MSALKVCYLGGTGTISWSCVKRSVVLGHEVSVVNRKQSAARPLPDEIELLVADVNDPTALDEAIEGRHFDVVVNFLSFTAAQAAASIERFSGSVGQYVHISTASLYHKPPARVPYLESTVRFNPGSRYSSDKLAAEDLLLEAYAKSGFPITIVRPSHTYDDAHPPLPGDWAVVERIARGEEIVVPGDGTSLWTLTHAEDFALGLGGLLGDPRAIGEAFHIASDFVATWNQIYTYFADALGVTAHLVHLPSDLISLGAPDWFWSELIAGDLQYSVLLDNSKIASFVPAYAPTITFVEGVRRMMTWREEHRELAVGDRGVDSILDRLVRGYHGAADAMRAVAP